MGARKSPSTVEGITKENLIGNLLSSGIGRGADVAFVEQEGEQVRLSEKAAREDADSTEGHREVNSSRGIL